MNVHANPVETWTAADAAEMDALLHALSSGYAEHRSLCRACRQCDWPKRWSEHGRSCRVCPGDAPLTYGTECGARDRFLKHSRTCPTCAAPCPHLREAIDVVLTWRHARALLSKAQALRIGQDVAA